MVARFALICLAGLILIAGFQISRAQESVQLFGSAQEAEIALRQAEALGREAGLRAEAFERQAASASAAAEKTAQEGAALAARVQQAEAQIVQNEARLRLIAQQQQDLRNELARRQTPLVELTGALQHLSRRPVIFALLRPGSLQDAVYLRAVLETMLPEVERRTAGLRVTLERNRQLQADAAQASANLRASQIALNQRRQQLIAVEARQRLELRNIGAIADREAERALALAEEARDLSGLMEDLGKTASLRAQLAALPGPILRPARPQNAVLPKLGDLFSPTIQAPAPYQLPVAGRLVSGFDDRAVARVHSRGITIAVRAGAQAVSPGAGRVAFAGPYPGYGSIVIIEHGGGWSSLVTGLAFLDVKVGKMVIAGSPLGLAGSGRPLVTLELRKDGTPLNPLDFLRR